MRLRAFGRDERGAVAVEFALIAPIFLLIVFGMVDFSRAFYTLNAVSSAVREGARTAATEPTLETSDPAAIAKVKTRVKNFMGGFGGPEVTDAMINVSTNNGSVIVTITNYPFSPITPLPNMGFLTNGTYPITRTAVFRHEATAAGGPGT